MPHASVLVRNLLVLKADARSGVLTVRGDASSVCRLYLRRGTLVFADDDTSRTGAAFAKRLVRDNALDTARVSQVMQLAQGAPGRNPALRFGEVAVELGFLRSDAMRASLTKEVRAAAVRVFQRNDVSWELDDTADALAGIVDLPMGIEAVFLEAVRWLDDEAKNAYGLASALDRKIKLEPGTGAAVAKRFELSADEAAFLLRFDGTRTARELVSARDTTIDAHALVTALVATRAVQAEGGTASGQIAAARPSASMRAAVERPPTPMPPSSNRRASGSGSVPATKPNSSAGSIPAARISGAVPAARTSDVMRALEAQKRTAARPATEEEKRLAQMTSREALARAKARGWGSAAQDFQRAVELDPDNFEYKVYAKYAGIRASNEPPHPVDRAELRRLSLVAVKVNPDFAFGYVAGAETMVDDGEHDGAHRMLTRALKLEPTQPDGLRLMRIVERRISEKRR